MPRPPKHVRDALKLAQEAGDLYPPEKNLPFDPVAEFCKPPVSMAPQPGMFEPVFDFSSPPEEFMDFGPPFGSFLDFGAEFVNQELPDPEYVPEEPLFGEPFVHEMFAGAYAAAAIRVASTCVSDPVCRSVFSLAHHNPAFPEYISERIGLLGEFLGPDGRPWKMGDPSANLRSFSRSAEQIASGCDPSQVAEKMWLPTRAMDGRTASIVEKSLIDLFERRGDNVPASDLIGSAFKGVIPPALLALGQPAPDSVLTSLELFFLPYQDEEEFYLRFTGARGQQALQLVGLRWNFPTLTDLGFSNPLEYMLDFRLRRWSSLTQRAERMWGKPFTVVNFRRPGHPLQLCTIREDGGRTVVRSIYKLGDSEVLTSACFGSPVVTPLETRFSAQAVSPPLGVVWRVMLGSTSYGSG